MLTMAVVIPATGWFLQRVTTRNGLRPRDGPVPHRHRARDPGTHLLASCSLARVVQASGTAVMMPLLMTTMMTLVPPQDRGKVMGNVTLVISVAPGPRAGRVGSAAPARVVAADLRRRAAHRRCRRHCSGCASWSTSANPAATRIDLPSVVLSAVGFGALVYGLSGLGDGGRASHTVPPAVVTAIGVLALVAFVRRQLTLQRGAGPLLDLRTLTFGPFADLARPSCAWPSWR